MRSNKNTATSLPMQNVAPVVHNHPQSYTGVAFVIGGFVLALIPAAWLGLCFLFEKLGSSNPEYSAATLVVIALCVATLWYPATWLFGNISATNHAHKVEIMRVMNEHAQTIARLQLQASTTGAIGARALESDYATARGCLAVLEVAYRKLDGRKYRANEARHWVRDTAWKIVNDANIHGVKWSDCSSFGDWLETNGFIVGDQLNRGKYPEFEDARREIDLIAAPPIKIN